MTKEKQTFLKGAMILGICMLIVKIIGATFKIPLTYVLGTEGMGIFNTAYTFYAAFFVIATAGIPVAISKMVSESLSRGNQFEAKRIFNVARFLLLIVGITGSVVLFFFADAFAVSISSDRSIFAIKAIAPAIFFVAVLSSYRGYFQGHQNMTPTAVSEIVESLGKLIIGLGLAIYFSRLFTDTKMPAMGAVLGVTAGTMLSLVTLLIISFFINKKKMKVIDAKPKNQPTMSKRQILKILVIMAIPITIGASVSTLTNVLDMLMVQSQLANLGFDSLKHIVLTIGIKDIGFALDVNNNIANIGENIRKMSTAIYGSYSGYAYTLFNFPLTIVTAISMSIVPAIAAAFEVKNTLSAKRTAETALRITLIFAMPCAFGLSVLAGPVLYSVFTDTAATQMLSILGYAVIFVSVVSVTTAMLQATGHIMLPVINMIIGGIVKVVINYFLVGNPDININGAPIGTNLCYLVIAVLNVIQVIRILDIKFNIVDFVMKPLISSAIMAGIAYFALAFCEQTHLFANFFIGEIRICTVIAMAVGGISYILMMFIVNGINRNDVVMLPAGEKIAGILTRLHLIK